MFEITRNDIDTLDYYLNEGMAHPGAEYDFTFESRWLIYHNFKKDEVIYSLLDMETKMTKQVYRCEDELHYDIAADVLLPKILRAVRYDRKRDLRSFDAMELIDTIFYLILPDYGFNIRADQVRLCKTIYRGLTTTPASTLEAEVGLGKSFAYIIATTVANIKREAAGDTPLPITITTSTIQLQKALVERDIPQISKILLETGIIETPLTSVLRKGKEHYFCLARYRDYCSTAKGKELKASVDRMFERRALDLDDLDLPSAVKESIHVTNGCKDCNWNGKCGYTRFLHSALNEDAPLTFQVTNHNLYLMSKQHPGLLRQSDYIIVDEAHKLKEATQSAFGAQLSEREIPAYLNWSKTLCCEHRKKGIYAEEQKTLRHMNSVLFSWLDEKLLAGDSDMESHSVVDLDDKRLRMMQVMIETIEGLEKIRDGFGGTSMGVDHILTSLEMLRQREFVATWVEKDENGFLSLCGCPKNLGEELHTSVWSSLRNHILLSGTMSAGDNFDYFKRETGLALLPKHWVAEARFPSPFDYKNQTRLYIANDLPMPDHSESYYRAISHRIVDLVHATNGHTAILFTSYRALYRVHELTKIALREYDVFCMTRSDRSAIDSFRSSKNGVLFASGSMWEGVDCVGDCLSSVIIVRLPFPRRTAVTSLKCAEYESVHDFVEGYAVPEMLIKLRQGTGRLIRSETDTGVLAILDVRAAKGRNAWKVQSALSQYPKVYSIKEIERFIRSVKPHSYFMGGAK